MKRVILFLVFELVLYISFSQTKSRLDAGTIIQVKNLTELNAADLFYNTNSAKFAVVYNVVDRDGNVLISAGTPVIASVQAFRPKAAGKGGKLTIQFVSTFGVDGQSIPLTGVFDKKGLDKKGKVNGLVWGLFFTVLGPLSLPMYAIKGENVEVSAGTNLAICNVNNTIYITAQK